jgi:hypothetical protein
MLKSIMTMSIKEVCVPKRLGFIPRLTYFSKDLFTNYTFQSHATATEIQLAANEYSTNLE